MSIDLTRARVGPGTSDIEVRSLFGNVEVTVVDPNAPGWLDKLAARFRK